MQLYIKKVIFEAPLEHTYVSEIPAFRCLFANKSLELENPVTFIVGENGSGKSTLLEAIAVAYGFNAEGGTKNFNFSSVQTHSPLYKSIMLAKGPVRPRDGFFLRAESFYNVASEVDRLDDGFGDYIIGYGGKSLHGQSHGESFISLVANRFGGRGLYLLDEPEAALSPSRQLSLLALIDGLVKNDSQLIIATHSPILLAYPKADILQLSEDGVKHVEYKETDSYLVTRRFLNEPEKYMRYLFEE